MMMGALVLPPTIFGMTLPSATRRLLRPDTLSLKHVRVNSPRSPSQLLPVVQDCPHGTGPHRVVERVREIPHVALPVLLAVPLVLLGTGWKLLSITFSRRWKQGK